LPQTVLSLDEIVRKTSDLPTIPAAAMAVMQEAESATSTASTVANQIAQDHALTARVLRLANSAYYGLSRQVDDLQEAVVVLGMRSVRNLAIVAATYPWMSVALKGYGLGPKQLWTHSFAVAVAAQLLGRTSQKADEDVAFTAGLLHNLGKLAMSIWLEKRITAMLQYAMRENMTFDEVERKLFGYDHAEVGAHLAEAWNLPPKLVTAIRYHHRPDECKPHDPVVDCVHVADYFTMSLGFGLGADGLRYDFYEGAMERLEIPQKETDRLLDKFTVQYEEYEKLFESLNPEA
jgi:putative nucleotidyltransferase with HDIG domain